MNYMKWLGILLASGTILLNAMAEEEAQNSQNPQDSSKEVVKIPVKKKAKGGSKTREKDADGTEAPDRFEADTVIKSGYKLNGQPLEVDPD